jgi:hypothetical protein
MRLAPAFPSLKVRERQASSPRAAAARKVWYSPSAAVRSGPVEVESRAGAASTLTILAILYRCRRTIAGSARVKI